MPKTFDPDLGSLNVDEAEELSLIVSNALAVWSANEADDVAARLSDLGKLASLDANSSDAITEMLAAIHESYALANHLVGSGAREQAADTLKAVFRMVARLAQWAVSNGSITIALAITESFCRMETPRLNRAFELCVTEAEIFRQKRKEILH